MDADDIEALLADISDGEPSAAVPREPRPQADVPGTPDRAAQLEAELAERASELQTLYAPRAPRLHEVGLAARKFARVVQVLGNDAAPAPAGGADALAAEVGSASALAIRLSLAQAAGQRLEPAAWRRAEHVAAHILELSAELDALVDAAAAALPADAPNLVRVLDARVAARLVARAGGLRALAATSPANIVSLRTSPLLSEPLVEQVPDRFKKQALRMVASKAVLAARMDSASAGSGADDTQGQLWRRQIEARMDRLLAAPPSLQHRALPKPVDKKTSRRGGKRVRKMKQKQAPTKLAHEQNIVRFGA